MNLFCSVVRRLPFFLILCGLVVAFSAARAEGSKELNSSGGSRVFLEWNTAASLGGNSAAGGLLRRTRILVYAQAGETINLGSSVTDSSDGKDIVYTSPSGAQAGVCDVLAGGAGLINTLAKERAGPLPNAGGYTPCVVTAAETGVYLIEFHGAAGGANPTPQLASAEITNAVPGSTVTAWDVTVRSGGVAFAGRVFTPYLSVNMGNTGQSLSSNVYVQTRDGYQYRVDFNGVDPYGFILVANRTGFALNGKPTFQSLQLSNNGADIPAGYKVGNEDPLDLNSFHKIYFNPPNPSLPATAAAPGGSIWLHPSITLPADISNVTFTGQDGTSGQFAPGTGGTFSYTALGTGTVQFALDLNGDGIYGNANDRVLFGTAEIGANTLIWDGRDGQGLPTASTATIRARAELAAGDVHFPYMDGETNTNGLIIERLTFPDANNYTVYWDDTPLTAVAAGTSSPTFATQGTSSVGGTHRYPTNFGDNRGIDTWALYPSGRPLYQDLATPGIADVSTTKTHSPTVLTLGQPLTYTVTVTNNSTLSQANGVRVTDSVPAAVTGTTWACVGTGGATCAAASGSGNTLNTTVNLPINTSVTFTVSGTLSSTYASSSLSNSASATRGADTSDPNLSNNSATDLAQIDVADVSVVKTGFTAAAPLSNVTYTLVFANNGPSSATVTPLDTFSNSTFVSASDSGTASGSVVTWPAVTLTSGQSITRTVVLKVSGTAGNSANTASFVSNKADLVATNNTSTVTTSVQPTSGPDVVVQKSGPALVRGQDSIFTLVPRNIGLQATSGTITVADTLPTGLTYRSATGSGWNCSGTVGGQTVSCTRGATVAAGATAPTISVTANTSQTAPDSLTNTATISGGGDSAAANNTSSVTLPVSSLADVQITKTPAATRNAKTDLLYTLAIKNNGPTNAASVLVSDPLPANTTYVSSSDSGVYDSATHTVSWPSFTLNSGVTANRTVTVTLPLEGTVINTASVSTTTPESSTANNSSTSSIPVTPIANLEIQKEGAASYGPSANLTYTLRVANFGPSNAATVTVSDTLPTGTTYVSNTGGGVYNAGTRTVTWTATSLAVTGPESNLTYTVTVLTPTSGTLSNTATVSTTTTDPTASNNSSTVGTTITPVADLQVSKTGPVTVLPSGDITYTISVLNLGPSTATAVTVTDLLPAGATRQNVGGGTYAAGAGGGTITWTLASLVSGASQNYTVVLRAPNTAATLVNAASATSPVSDPDPTNNDGTNPTAQVTTTVNVNADLQITKTAPATVRGGAPLSYTLTVTNAGPAEADGAALQDPSISGFTASSVSCTPSGSATCPASLSVGTLQAGTVIPTFPALGKLVITLSGTAASGGQIINTATITVPSTRTDPDSTNNSSAATTDTVNLTLSKSVQNLTTGSSVSTSSTGKPGDTLEYCITYNNIGSAALPNLTLSDTLPTTTQILPTSAYVPGSNIRFVRTPARLPTPDPANPSNAAGDDAGTLDTVMTYLVGTTLGGETGTVCFRANVK